jgi:phenylacetate-CoA ligase
MAIDFRVREFFYPLTLYRLHREMERNQWLPAAALQGLQEKLLRRTLIQAERDVPFYRRLFREIGVSSADIRTLADLKRLPLLSKQAVRLAGRDLLAQNAHGQHPRRYFTSGTAGDPMAVYHGRTSNALEFAFYWRHWSWAGFMPGRHFAELQTTFFLRCEAMSERLSWWQPLLGRLLLNGNRVGAARATAMACAIRRHGCLFLKGMASTLACFALACREAGVDDLRFRALFATGEILFPRLRRLIESVFRSPVLDSYGQMERTAAICQCPAGGYHVNSDYGVLEIEDLRPVESGRSFIGRAVGTSLHNPVMPLVRYDIGDRIEVDASPAPCPCGRTLPLVKAVHGRTGDPLVAADGTYLTSLHVLPTIMMGAAFVQFVQEAPDRLLVLLVPERGWNAERRERALRITRQAVGPSMAISWQEVGVDGLARDASGKISCVIPLAQGKNRIYGTADDARAEGAFPATFI